MALPALDTLPVAHEERTRCSVAVVATNSACSAAVALAVGLPLRSHRVSEEAEEADPAEAGVGMNDAAPLA